MVSIAYKECEDRFYGKNCSTACGHCANSTFCDKNNGTCQAGCQENWEYPLCDGNNTILLQNFRTII